VREDAGYLVETKTGKIGRTYHREGYINGKAVVHIEENGKTTKMLCDPETLKITGFID
jgi:hypothetical protein